MKKSVANKEEIIFYAVIGVYLIVCVGFLAVRELSREEAYISVSEMTTAYVETSSPEQVLININTASLEELVTLDGIGEKTAQKIIEYREMNNGFLNVDELLEVSGIGEAKLDKIRNSITVG